MPKHNQKPLIAAEQSPDQPEAGVEKTEADPNIRARTWNQARNLISFPDDDYLADFLSWRQTYPKGEPYSYLIRRPTSPEDRQALDRQLGAAYHYQLASLVGQKFRVEASPHYDHPPQNQAVIDRATADYQGVLNGKAHRFWAKASQDDYPPADDPDFKLDGFSILIDDEEKKPDETFLLDPALSTNIYFPNKSFVYWGSQAQIERVFDQNHQPTVGRIYLNPAIDKNVEVFADLIDLFDQNQAACDAKIFNRALEAGGDDTPTMARSEGITVYVSADQADKVLGLVLDYYQNNPQVFANRQAPPLAAEVAPGIGLATQEGFDSRKHSFNGHRAEIFDQAWKLLQTAEMPPGSPPQQRLAAFKYILEQLCIRQGVDPQNIAFAGKRPATAQSPAS